jgi:predicted O-methyltransferase YrrM
MIRRTLRRFRTWLQVDLARKEDLDHLYNQVAGLGQIAAALKGERVVRPLRGWALSPDAAVWILADLQQRQSPTVIEFGSGQSTIIFATVMKNRGGGRLISIEHDAAYAAEVGRQLEAHGLQELVDLRVLPLEERTESGGLSPCRSYPIKRLPDVMVDLAVIDGPPLANGNLTRFFPLRWALLHLRENGTIYLDDSKRPAEQQVLARVRTEFPNVTCSELPTERGLSLFKPGSN